MFNYVRLSEGGIERIASVRSEVRCSPTRARGVRRPRRLRGLPPTPDVREAIARMSGSRLRTSTSRAGSSTCAAACSTPALATEDARTSCTQVDDDAPTEPALHAAAAQRGQFNRSSTRPRRYRASRTAGPVREPRRPPGLDEGDQRPLAGSARTRLAQDFDLPRGTVAAYYPERTPVPAERRAQSHAGLQVRAGLDRTGDGLTPGDRSPSSAAKVASTAGPAPPAPGGGRRVERAHQP